MTSRAGSLLNGVIAFFSDGKRLQSVKGSAMLNVAVSGGVAPTKLYKNQGWYTAGGIYESWISSTPGGSPPSGHTLTNIQFVPLQG